jgi:hypothetical protein
MEKLISKLVNRFVKESFVDITDKNTEEAFQEVTEKLHGGQHKIDVAEPKGKITSADFKKLRQTKSKKQEVEENIFKKMFGKKEDSDDTREKDKEEHTNLWDAGYDYDDIQGWHIPPPGKHRFDRKNDEDGEVEEGNAFTGALAKAKEEGDDTFEVDGETYSVKKESVNKKIERILENRKKKLNEKWDDSVEDKRGGSYIGKPLERLQMDLAAMNSKIESFKKENEGEEVPSKMKEKLNQIKFAIRNARKTKNEGEVKEEKFIQKATQKMEKKGTSGKFGVWCKKEGLDKDGEVTKKCINQAMKSKDSDVVKMANFAKNIGGFKGAKHESIKENTVRFTESEMIDFIERIVEAEVKEKNTVKSLSMSKKVNDDATKEVVEKMKKYMKDMGKEYNEKNKNEFPTGNKSMSREDFGKEVTDDKKKAYKASDAVDEYIDAFAYPGQTNLVFDEIKPVDEKIEKYLKGDSTTGNAQVDEDGNALGNVVPSKIGEKMFKNYKENLYGAEQQKASYKRVKQPVDVAGEDTQSGRLNKSAKKSQEIFDKLDESIQDKKILTDLEKMKKLIGYNQKTQ